MVYKGHVENGVIKLDNAPPLEDGTAVEVVVSADETQSANPGSFLERYREFVGVLDDMPADCAENHDKYLRERFLL